MPSEIKLRPLLIVSLNVMQGVGLEVDTRCESIAIVVITEYATNAGITLSILQM